VNVPVVRFLQGFSVDQAVTQVLEQLATETTDLTVPPSSPVAPLEERQNAERLLANLDQLSDDQVNALLSEMLAEENVGSTP
jgi:phthiocerol/phenolphthiocerol synthesis type-I polyketide synthase D